MIKIEPLITAIEDAGIKVKSFQWTGDEELNIEVDEADQERAGEIVSRYWKEQWEQDHIGLIAVPIEEESK